MIIARLIIEIAGYPKDHIESVMKGLMEKVKKEYDVDSYDIFEAKKVKNVDKIFSTFTEMEIKFKGIRDLVAFCYDKMPSSVEIIEPIDHLDVKVDSLQDMFNDLMSKLHEYDSELKELKARNILLERNVARNT